MSDEPPNNTPPADPPKSDPGSGPAPFRVFQTKEQYEQSLNRKLANYVPKTELDSALNRASALENSLGSVQTELQGLKTKLSSYELGDLRQKVGKEAGLPADWIEELKGTDEASLKAHAEILRKKLSIRPQLGGAVPPNSPPQKPNALNAAFLQAIGRGGGR